MLAYSTFFRLGFLCWTRLGKAFACHDCMSITSEFEVYDLQGIKRGHLDD